MGIYQDIQDDLKEAMLDDLADAVAVLVVTEEVSSMTYNPVGGVPTIALPEVYTMNCIVMKDHEEKKDGEDTTTDFVELLVLDTDKTIDVFKPGMKANVRNTDYQIGKVGIDPVGATHTLKCRKI